MGPGPVSKLQVEPGEEGGRYERCDGAVTRAQAGSWDISLKAWDKLNALQRSRLRATHTWKPPQIILERDRVDIYDVKLNSIQQGDKSETLSSHFGRQSVGELWLRMLLGLPAGKHWKLGALSSMLGSNGEVN